jgi:hypothetical protein
MSTVCLRAWSALVTTPIHKHTLIATGLPESTTKAMRVIDMASYILVCFFSRRCHPCIPNFHRYANADTIALVGQPRTAPTPSAQEAQDLQIQSSNHDALRHMLPFALLVLSFMLLMFYWVGFR